jgi:TetR/AcrR family transcriptional regulator, transcriptional repressor for nem operon
MSGSWSCQAIRNLRERVALAKQIEHFTFSHREFAPGIIVDFGWKRRELLGHGRCEALDHYIESSIEEHIRRCEVLLPRDAIRWFFDDILRRSLSDRERKGCMLVNSALEMGPHDPEFRETIAGTLKRIESFFLARVKKGQADGTITSSRSAVGLAQHLLGVLVGVLVLAGVRPERPLLEDVISTAVAFLDGP